MRIDLTNQEIQYLKNLIHQEKLRENDTDLLGQQILDRMALISLADSFKKAVLDKTLNNTKFIDDRR